MHEENAERYKNSRRYIPKSIKVANPPVKSGLRASASNSPMSSNYKYLTLTQRKPLPAPVPENTPHPSLIQLAIPASCSRKRDPVFQKSKMVCITHISLNNRHASSQTTTWVEYHIFGSSSKGSWLPIATRSTWTSSVIGTF